VRNRRRHQSNSSQRWRWQPTKKTVVVEAVMSCVRIKLDLSQVIGGDCPLQWTLVEPQRFPLVSDFVRHLVARHDIKTGLELFLEDCLIPNGQSIAIIQNGDLIQAKLATNRKRKTSANLEDGNVAATTAVTSVKAKKPKLDDSSSQKSKLKHQRKAVSPAQKASRVGKNESSSDSESSQEASQKPTAEPKRSPQMKKAKSSSRLTPLSSKADEGGQSKPESTSKPTSSAVVTKPLTATVSRGNSSNKKIKFKSESSTEESSCSGEDDENAVAATSKKRPLTKAKVKAEEQAQEDSEADAKKRKRKRKRKQKNKNKLSPEDQDSSSLQKSYQDAREPSEAPPLKTSSAFAIPSSSSNTYPVTPSSKDNVPASSPATPSSADQRICRFFARGACKRSDTCKFIHQRQPNVHKDLSNVDDVSRRVNSPRDDRQPMASAAAAAHASSNGTPWGPPDGQVTVNGNGAGAASSHNGHSMTVWASTPLTSSKSTENGAGSVTPSKSVKFGPSFPQVSCEEALLGPQQNGSHRPGAAASSNSSSSSASKVGTKAEVKRPQRNDDSSIESRHPSLPASPSAYNGLEALLALAGTSKQPVKGSRGSQPKVAPKAAATDYASLPNAMWGHMQTGKKVAFKLLEMTASYEPVISDYKNGAIVSVEQPDKITVQLDDSCSAQPNKTGGRFEIEEEEENVLSGATEEERLLTLSWSDLIEPRVLN